MTLGVVTVLRRCVVAVGQLLAAVRECAGNTAAIGGSILTYRAVDHKTGEQGVKGGLRSIANRRCGRASRFLTCVEKAAAAKARAAAAA